MLDSDIHFFIHTAKNTGHLKRRALHTHGRHRIHERWKQEGGRMGNEEINEYRMTKFITLMTLSNKERGWERRER